MLQRSIIKSPLSSKDDAMNTQSNNRINLYIFLFFVCVYITTTSGSVHVTVDGTVRFAVTKNIVESFSVSIPEEIGRDNGIVGVTGKYYTWYGVGQSALMVPFYVIGKFLGNPEFIASLFNPLISAATCVVIFLFCASLDYSNKTSAIVSLIYGLGTIAWPQSKGPFEHPLETILTLLSLLLLHLHVKNKSYPKLILSAVVLGVAIITRVPTLITFVPVTLYLLLSHIRKKTVIHFFKESLMYGMTLVPFGIFFLCYNFMRFGDILETGYSKIFNQWGIDAFSTPWLVGLSGLIFSPGKGFFFYSPIAILFILAIRTFYKKNPDLTVAFLTIIGAFTLFNSKYYVWHGDWAWGPRLLTIVTPYLIIPIGELFESGMTKRVRIKILVTSLLAISILIQISAVTVNLNKYFINNQFTSRNLPNRIYFNPGRCPIKEQFKYVIEIVRKIGYYEPTKIQAVTTDLEAVNEQITLNVPDFWYVYYVYSGVPKGSVAVVVILLTIVSAFSLIMISRRIYCKNALPLQIFTKKHETALSLDNLDRK